MRIIPPSAPVTPPLLNTHSKKIQALIRRLRTPLQVQTWLKTLDYNLGDTMRTLHRVHRDQRAHCLEGVLAAAAILEFHGYPPLILDLESADKLDHTLFLYRRRGRFGTVGISRDIGLAGRKPVYKTIHALVQSYAAPFIDKHARITGYGVLDLRTLRRQDWRNAKTDVWFVENALLSMPHRRFRSSPKFVRTWRKRFLAFKKVHPDEQPDYFSHQKFWS